jgi:hypothetical protein
LRRVRHRLTPKGGSHGSADAIAHALDSGSACESMMCDYRGHADKVMVESDDKESFARLVQQAA